MLDFLDGDLSQQIVGAPYALRQLICFRAASMKKVCVVLPNEKKVDQWYQTARVNELSDLTRIPVVLPWNNERFSDQSQLVRLRIHGLSSLLQPRQPGLVLTTLGALSQYTLSESEWRRLSFKVVSGSEHDVDELVQKLADIGYRQANQVEEPGVFAVRGGLLDLFCVNSVYPVRIEFIGDEVVSMREFRTDTQRSLRSVEEIQILPAQEAWTPPSQRSGQTQQFYQWLIETGVDVSDREGMVAAFQQTGRVPAFEMYAPLFRESFAPTSSLLSQDIAVVFPDSIPSSVDHFAQQLEGASVDFERDLKANRAALPLERHFKDLESSREFFECRKNSLEFGNPMTRSSSTQVVLDAADFSRLDLPLEKENADSYEQWMSFLAEKLSTAKAVILTQSEEGATRLRGLLEHRDLPSRTQPDGWLSLDPELFSDCNIVIGKGELSSPVWLAKEQLLVLPETVFFGEKQIKKIPEKATLKAYLSSFSDLRLGDLVVHVQHGIGRYRGMKELAVAGASGDFLVLEYAGGDLIYLPVDKLNLLQRYQSSDNAKPAIDKLQGGSWKKRKGRVRKAVKDMAEQLLKNQALRETTMGNQYAPINDDYIRMEAEFPYTETEDQVRAIADVHSDLSKQSPMDRLICGDVGFGKTEVAIRASYRAVLGGYQVIVLVPTTVLCYQHFQTFSKRLSSHGVSIEQVNRFVASAKMKQVVADFASGKVDVLIGTHKVLAKQIKPSQLGMIVVDEEQKFGVTHKEKLKELKQNCDILTLSATPIPRTLHQSMLGLRDISIIATPPPDRLAVKTYVSRFEPALVSDAITFEVNRGGQVFFVHNRVQDIVEITGYLQKLHPEISFRFAHGQMSESKLEKTVVDFLGQKFQVLVCTAIIESGIDMPNVNTLIVNRADRFGLAQLYQLRGRVGRSARQAYAYFLGPENEKMSDEAAKRFDVLLAHQDLGSGFQVASHDLELRGAGNLLGQEQSGQVADVGLDLYTSMLEQAINEIRTGEDKVDREIDAEIKIPFSVAIPHNYIPYENGRLQLYKSLFSTANLTQLSNLREETMDRYGELPPSVDRLFRLGALKQTLRSCGASLLSESRSLANGDVLIEIRFGALSEDRIGKLIAVTSKKPQMYQLTPDYRLLVNVKPQKNQGDAATSEDFLLDGILAAVQPLYQD